MCTVYTKAVTCPRCYCTCSINGGRKRAGGKNIFPHSFLRYFPFSLFICGKCDNEGLGGKSFGLEELREVGSKCPAPPPCRSTNLHIATPPPPFPPSFFPWKLGGAFKGVTLPTPLPPLSPPTVWSPFFYGSRYIMAAAYRPPLGGGGTAEEKASFSNGFGFMGRQRGKFESGIIVSKHEREFFIASSKNVEAFKDRHLPLVRSVSKGRGTEARNMPLSKPGLVRHSAIS